MIRATVTTGQKEYVDRGVQTDLVRRLSRDPTKPVNPRVFDTSVPVTPPKSTLFVHSHTIDAYSGSSGHAVGPTRSPPTRKHHPQLPYSRPSHIQSLTQRVLSLPETSPPHSTRVPPEIRRVSLSGLPRASLSFSDNTNESSDTSFLSDNRSGSSRPRRSFPSSDVPQTPSPPSSPESVMIIGNDKQVPISFLRQKAKAAYEDDNGDWISWASSPPKPIPALHGPLSLPYARCPSGAEGTIIEGEDLSRMIWGLGIEDGGTQPTHSRANSTHTSHKPTPKTTFTPRLQQHDTSQFPTRHQPQRALESLGPRHSFRPQIQDGSLNIPQLPDTWSETREDLIGSIQDQLYAYDGQGGFDWQENLRRQLSSSATEAAPRSKPQNALKPSAPVFVPASQQVTPQFPRIFVEPRIPHTINPPRRLTAIEIAQQYQQRAQSSLPTPPGSSSPQWTPHLQTYTDPFPPLDLHALLPKHRPNLPQQPLVHELQQFPVDRSQQLRNFVFDRMQNPSMGSNEFGLHNQLHMSSPAVQYRRTAIEMSPPPPGPPPNSPLPPLPSSRGRSGNFFLTPSSPTSPDPSVLHRSAPKPRSIPFARLLRRRLSSVPEEESGHYMEAYSPPPSPPKMSTALRLPRPPSHTLADSFQSRSQTGRRHVTRTPSPGRNNGFGSHVPTPSALESDATRRGAARSKGFLKQPFAMANFDAGSDSRGEGSKTDGSAGESGWEKENGKSKKRARSKKAKFGGAAAEDTVSPWVAASQAPEAWL
ncbi:hypothetical protein FB45DRAFT_821669 [Roridomyces roridus]|uniref:Uncharacterized protein n=1 Tax=Roridomyces roridus TaxID=1738132 RepID=A0AAD7CES1_9AGAR|nr:hypothetical protein FB45DRAFT_821669 [Roridomyces roridus]